MAQRPVLCRSEQLIDGGRGLRFQVRQGQDMWPAFVVRYQGAVHAYLNRCAHKGVELDWEAGEFFDAERRHLICATHGALYEPASGLCVQGPCRGAALRRLPVREADGVVTLDEEAELHLVHSGSTDVP